MAEISRRAALLGAGALALNSLGESALAAPATGEGDGIAYGSPETFSFQRLKAVAQRLARRPWRATPPVAAEILQEIDYDAYFQIAFRKDHTIRPARNDGTPIQLFHLGRYQREPVSISIVEDGTAREILYRQAYFDIPDGHIAHRLPEDIGFAGFRVMDESLDWDWLSFLGASYFRSPGSGRQYGLSARGVAIDTGLASGEEFPRFSRFFLEAVPGERDRLIVHALLEGPSLTGAYRFDCTRQGGVVMDTEAELYPRQAMQRLGMAPLTSMFWYSQKDRRHAIDWRPEIHDSDGLAIWTGSDERIWRPLNNPPTVMTNSFTDENPKGFGLLQRDRDFDHYQDDNVFYHLRPSLWVEPRGPWGRGAVQLVEIPTGDETHDNIVAYWVPEMEAVPGRAIPFAYRLHWNAEEPFPSGAGRVVDTFIGAGGIPGQARPRNAHQFVVDFTGGDLARFAADDGVVPVIDVSRGRIGRAGAYPVVGRHGLFRAAFELHASGAEPLDLRLYLKHGERALTETWIYQFFPDSDRLRGSG
ncbi:glucan biosynthesis protein [Afifella pfennigii]|uniref:glucan biosynthesis protein n=1 Tax=Afifella pfennigii TaxID=209897 RepID=UPI00047EF995|nr:glucan biosynthesis protein D [Afifella pfennigii]